MRIPILILLFLAALGAPPVEPRASITVYGVGDPSFGTYARVGLTGPARITADDVTVEALAPGVRCAVEPPHYGCDAEMWEGGETRWVLLRLGPTADRIVVTRGLGEELARWERDAPAPTPIPTPEPAPLPARQVLVPVFGP